MKLSVSCVIFLSGLMSITPLFAGTQNLSTYYPAPQGNYLNMIVNGSLSLPTSAACSQTTSPNIVLANNAGILEICDSAGTYSLTTTSLWASNGGNLYPANTQGSGGAETVSVGSQDDAGGYTFNVIGTMGVSGLATLNSASIGDTQSTTLEVSGLATLGSASVTGNTTSGSLSVTGATTLSLGVTISGAVATISNGLTVSNPGILEVDNGTNIKLCTSGANCGTFGVAQGSDSNYYATYAP